MKISYYTKKNPKLGFFFNAVRSASSGAHTRYLYSRLRPGALAAHEWFCLVLLCSQPDTVHRYSLRKTQTSTLLIKGSYTSQSPQSEHHPCYSGLQVQGTAATPAARLY